MSALTHRPENTRYEMEIEGKTVFANYRREGNILHITHVEAPVELRGKGAASQLMQAIMEHAKKERLNVNPICSYAAAWIQRHPEYQ